MSRCPYYIIEDVEDDLLACGLPLPPRFPKRSEPIIWKGQLLARSNYPLDGSLWQSELLLPNGTIHVKVRRASVSGGETFTATLIMGDAAPVTRSQASTPQEALDRALAAFIKHAQGYVVDLACFAATGDREASRMIAPLTR